VNEYNFFHILDFDLPTATPKQAKEPIQTTPGRNIEDAMASYQVT
jgi:hypothetical protein